MTRNLYQLVEDAASYAFKLGYYYGDVGAYISEVGQILQTRQPTPVVLPAGDSLDNWLAMRERLTDILLPHTQGVLRSLVESYSLTETQLVEGVEMKL